MRALGLAAQEVIEYVFGGYIVGDAAGGRDGLHSAGGEWATVNLVEGFGGNRELAIFARLVFFVGALRPILVHGSSKSVSCFAFGYRTGSGTSTFFSSCSLGSVGTLARSSAPSIGTGRTNPTDTHVMNDVTGSR